MINYDSILSAFDGKPTLLQWLKMVKKALDESILKNVNITQNGQKVVFTFNFEDGTSISTPEVTLPKGDTGATGPKGDTGATGQKGNDGVSITGINAVGSEVAGDKTLTTLRAHYSNDTTDDFVVSAKNGKDGNSGNIYLHLVKLYDSAQHSLTFNFYSKKETLTFEDVISRIPTDNYGIPGSYEYGNEYGILSVKKTASNTGYTIFMIGTVNSNGSSAGINFNFKTVNLQMTDTLIGTNL